MVQPVSLPVEIDASTLGDLRHLAASRGISEATLIGDAIRRLVAEDALDDALALGRDQVAAGEVLTHTQLASNLRHWRETRVRPPRCG